MFFRIEQNSKTVCYYEFNSLEEFFAYVDYVLFKQRYDGFNYGKSSRTGLRIINFISERGNCNED